MSLDRFRGTLLDPQDGTGVELFYNVQVTPWLNRANSSIVSWVPCLDRVAGHPIVEVDECLGGLLIHRPRPPGACPSRPMPPFW